MNDRSAPPGIAVVASSVLTGLGLKSVLGKIIPAADVAIFTDFDAFIEADPERFVHYFVAAPLFRAHEAFFRERIRRTILLVDTRSAQTFAGMRAIDVGTSEERLVHDLLQLHRTAHRLPATPQATATAPLTEREAEVLVLIARGFTNKQIARQLDIGLTTAITHRRNLAEKLGMRSVAELTLYALTAGYVDPEQF